MRSRSRVRSLFVPLAIVGVLGAASVASASTDTTTPDDTAAAGTEPAGTEPAGTAPAGTAPAGTEPAGTEPAGSAPEGGGPGAGAGSGSDSGIEGADLAGTTVTIMGVETSEQEAGGQNAAAAAFTEASGIQVIYTGLRDFEAQIGTLTAGGSPPDIALFPQPGRLAGFATNGDVLPLPDDVLANVSENWSDDWMSFGNIDGTQFGVPLKSDLKSLVWYIPSAFAEKGYEVPTTLDDFFALTEEMAANGDTPLCVGIESSAATGWPFTDWVEELILREQGIDFYNQWVNHEVPFNDPKVVDTFNEVAGPDGLWTKEGAVFASGGSIAATAFGDNATPLVIGDCMMHRQASFYSSFFPEGTEFGDGPGQVSTFYFPADEGHPVLVGGISAGAFRDAPEVWQVMEYLASADFANARQAAQVERVGGAGSLSGFLTGNTNADISAWAPLEQGFIEQLQTAEPAAFDASDQMPAEVGSGTFWSEGTSFVNGDEDAETATGNIDASWPS
jgi:alpha-glucoside transport system substrate-binding protein